MDSHKRFIKKKSRLQFVRADYKNTHKLKPEIL